MALCVTGMVDTSLADSTDTAGKDQRMTAEGQAWSLTQFLARTMREPQT